jgi:PAS domain S-box-containing protein
MAGERRDPQDGRRAEGLAALRDENAAIRGHARLLAALGEVNIDATFVKDRLGRNLMINIAGARLLGKSIEEVVGRDDTELFDLETAGRIMAIDREVIAQGMTRTFQEVATSTGVTRSYVVTKGPYRDDQGRVIGVIGISRDVTYQVQAEEALREAREFLVRLLDNATALIYVATEDGRARLVNAAWEAMFGMRREDVVGRPVGELFTPEVSATLLARNRQVLETAEPLSLEEEIDSPGGRRSFSTVKFPLRDSSGRIEAVGGISFDVTERKLAERSLEESRHRLQALFDTTLDAIWLLDDQGRFVDANPAMCSLLGYTLEEFLRMGIEDITPEENRGLVKDLWRTILDAGQSVGEFCQRAKDGSTREVEYRAVAHILPGLHLSVNRDISERKRAEGEARTLNAALENAVEGISRIDAEERYVTVKRAYAGMLGYRPEELIGQDWRITVHPRFVEESTEAYRRMRIEGRSEIEVVGLRRDGSTFWKQNVKVRALDAGGRYAGHFCFTKDITRRKEAELALRDSSERLKDLSRRLIRAEEDERRRIARELHDEIGQALTALKINHQAAIQCGEDMAARLEESVAIVDLALGQVSGMSLDLRPSILDDLGLVAALGWYVGRHASRTGLFGRFVADPDDIHADPEIETACFRVAQEALTNVARHARATRFSVELPQHSGGLQLVVRDDGIGFDTGRALDAASRGSSLGLVGMRERVELVGGRIAFVSGSDAGVEVQAEFPVAPIAPHPSRDEEDPGGMR